MIDPEAVKEKAPYLFEIERGYSADMQVPARIIINREMIASILADQSLEQLINVASLPGIEGYALGLPDIHQGYGFPVGAVAALRVADGVISPGGIGYDINCGVRLLLSGYSAQEIKPFLAELASKIQRAVPSGVGGGGSLVLTPIEMQEVLARGMRWALQNGYALEEDLDATEEGGCFEAAEPHNLSDRAIERGLDQLGTIGAGNHFVEVQRVSEIYDPHLAAAFGLADEQVTILIHTGSRGLGYQTCSDYVRLMAEVMPRYAINLPDRQLASVPFKSVEGQRYFGAMQAAANFAWTNRQLITHRIRTVFHDVLHRPNSLCTGDRLGKARELTVGRESELQVLYDVSHNIAKLESYRGYDCIVHRKGATRAFGPGRPELPSRFQVTGQPVLIPGSMGTSSYVLAGTQEAMNLSFGSCCHGAGRTLSRTAARREIDYNKLVKNLQALGIEVRRGSASGLLEEAPQAYKDIDTVIHIVKESGIAKVVAKLVPMAVVKG